MRSFGPERANFHSRDRIHPALTSFTDEVVATLARLVAYMGTLGLVGILGVYAFNQWIDVIAAESAADAGWAVADRSHPAFAVTSLDLFEKSASYTILRHPAGGRKDIFRWTGEADRPLGELELYRLGGEFDRSTPPRAAVAARMVPNGAALEPAGVVDSKFGQVALFRRTDEAEAAPACVGFVKRFETPDLQIAGFSCRQAGLPAQRAAIACTLNRLMLVTSGNDPKLAEMFARAELKRAACAPAAAPMLSADWVTGADDPHLRGAL
jgi:hypothetical protein